jgi:hypothetical protein
MPQCDQTLVSLGSAAVLPPLTTKGQLIVLARVGGGFWATRIAGRNLGSAGERLSVFAYWRVGVLMIRPSAPAAAAVSR